MSFSFFGSIHSSIRIPINSSTSATSSTSTLPYSTNLALWLDASDTTSFTLSGSNIIQWNDKSGNSRHAVVFSGTPTVISSGMNSLNTVNTTKNNYLRSPVVSGTFSSGVTMFIVFRYISSAGLFYPTLVNRTSGNQAAPWDFYNTNRYVGNGSNTIYATSNFSFTSFTTPTIYVCTISNSSVLSTTINGNIEIYQTLSNYADNASNIQIGTRGDLETDSNVYFGEILIFSGILSGTNISLTNEYLKSKWGVSYTSNVNTLNATKSTSGSYTLYAFTSTSSTGLIRFLVDTTVNYLIVGGGGGGGGGGCGGGGGGGVLYGSFTMTSGTTYSITVGSGGVGATTVAGASLTNGGNSFISGSDITTITAYGGGRGASRNTVAQSSSSTTTVTGSGGGGSSKNSSNTTAVQVVGYGYQGFNGGTASTVSTTGRTIAGAGGAGASANGGDADVTTPGNGGNGFTWFINNTAYGGGGGGATRNTQVIVGGTGGSGGGGSGATGTTTTSGNAGSSGTANTGGGGGAGSVDNGNGGAGGSGIVIISYTTIGLSSTFPYKTNIQLWLDPTDSTYLTYSGSTVTNWYDKSGGSRLTTIYGSISYISSGINSLPCAYINATSTGSSKTNYLRARTIANTFSSGVTMFVVYRYLGGITSPCLIQRTDNSNSNNAAPWYFYGATRRISNGFNSDTTITGSTAYYSTDTNCLFIATINSTTRALISKVNGVADASGTSSYYGDTASINIDIGAAGATNQDFNNLSNTYFGDIIVYSGVLSDTNILSVESYLKSKWGLTYTRSWTSTLSTLSYTTNLALWLDASDPTNFSLSGSNITQWNDKSGNSRNATVFNGSPSVTSFCINDLSCVYTSLNNYLTASIPANTFSAGLTMFIVYKYVDTVGLTTPTLVNRTLGSQPAPWDFTTTSRKIGNGTSNSSITSSLNISSFTDPTIFVCSISSSAVISSTLNGNIDVFTTLSNYSDAGSNIQIGTNVTKTYDSNTYFGEILIYSSVLTSANISITEEYLKSKWGINYTSNVYSSGATISTSGNYSLYSFTSTSTTGYIRFAYDTTINYLVVGGGGGGGGAGGGGGGAGGVLYGSFTMVAGTTYSITVGTGGNGSTTDTGTNSTDGSSSSISGTGLTTITALGGGKGASRTTTVAQGTSSGSKGSGGGGSGAASTGTVQLAGFGTTGQGNNGGSGTAASGSSSCGGGGGGAGGVGTNAVSGTAGNGGNGITWSINNSTYGGGGGGGIRNINGATTGSGGSGGGGNGGVSTGGSGSNGTANTGGGGGGSSVYVAGIVGGNGGSGIVIIAY